MAESAKGRAGAAREGGIRAPGFALPALALLVIALALLPLLRGAFVYDDLLLVQRNPTIRSLERLPEAITGPYWDFLDPGNARQIGYWRPLSAVALFLGNLLGAGRPQGFHAVSLALHLAAAAAAFRLARRISRSRPVAFWTALLFGLHPVQIEPVAWISSLSDPLYGALALRSLDAFLAWRERGSRGAPWLSGALLLAALLAKENAAAVLPAALALDLGRARRETEPVPAPGPLGRLRPFVRAYAPLAAAGFLYYLARAAVFGDPWAGLDRTTTSLGLPLARDLGLRVELLGGFLGLLAWPAHLNLFREVRLATGGLDLELWKAAGWIALWIAALAVLARLGARPALAALLLCLAGVVPALLRLESLGRFPLSERFLYLSVFGVALLAALAAKRSTRKPAAWAVLAAVVLAAGLRGHARAAVWRDEETLFRASAEASPRSVYVHWGLGRVLLEKARSRGDPQALREAFAAFERAQDLAAPPDGSAADPGVLFTMEDVLQANLGLGHCYLLCALNDPKECSLDEAAAVFERTLALFPGSEGARNGLGVARMYQGRLDEAEREFQAAAASKPSSPKTWFHLAQVDVRRGRWREAAVFFERSLAIEPANVETLVWHATALLQTEDPAVQDAARRSLERALELAPDHPPALTQLALIALRRGNEDFGLETLDRALRIDGTLADAHFLRAKVLLRRGAVERAVQALELACRWDPAGLEAHALLGTFLFDNGDPSSARPYLERALQIQPEGLYAAEIRKRLESMPPEKP